MVCDNSCVSAIPTASVFWLVSFGYKRLMLSASFDFVKMDDKPE